MVVLSCADDDNDLIPDDNGFSNDDDGLSNDDDLIDTPTDSIISTDVNFEFANSINVGG